MSDVVVSGIGTVNALGVGFDCFAEALREGESGIRGVEFPASQDGNHLRAALVDAFDVDEFLPTPKNYLDRDAELAFGAVALALEDAALDVGAIDKSRTGLLWATSQGGLDTMNRFFADVQSKGPRFAKPILFPHAYANTAISLLSVEYKLDGPHLNFSGGWDAGAQAVIAASDLIRRGLIDRAVVGASTALGETALKHFATRHPPAPDGDGALVPFPDGNGAIVPGEAAAALILETREVARQRGARVHADILGGSMTHNPNGWNEGEGAAILTAARDALERSGLGITQLSCLLANANGSFPMDAAEKCALEELTRTVPNTPVFTVKPFVGETLATAGVTQIATAVSTLKRGRVPRILNVSDHAAALPFAVTTAVIDVADLANVLTITLDPGGGAAAIVVSRPRI